MAVRLTDLADYLRSRGLTVVEHPGCDHRGEDLPGKPDTILCHHTATSAKAKGDLPSLRLLVEGRPPPKPLPGPLCQLALSRSGVVHVIATGKANHAGKGHWRGQRSSASTVGIEAEHPGGDAPWPAQQLAAYVQLCAALCRYLEVDPNRVAGHKEWALPKGRKPDPNLDMDDFRAQVRAALATPQPTPPPVQPEGPSMVIVKNPKGNDQHLVHMGRRWQIRSVEELAAYEKVCPRVTLPQGAFDRLVQA